jgi:ribosomal protein L24
VCVCVCVCVNMFKKNQKPTKQGQKGQVIEKNGSIHVSNVALKK